MLGSCIEPCGGVTPALILDIVSVRASWTAGRLNVAFKVVPADHSHLDLKTGEIFQSARYAALRKQAGKAISATLYVGHQERNAAGAEMPSEMCYVSVKGEGYSEICFIWRLPDDQLAAFHRLLLAGKVPWQAIVSLPFSHDYLKFRSEPGGSGKEWDNERAPEVPIENVEFILTLQVARNDEVLGEPETVFLDVDGAHRSFYSDAARVNYALIGKLSAIESAMARLSWTVGVIALLTLALTLARFWH
jgi:hypothetical protein